MLGKKKSKRPQMIRVIFQSLDANGTGRVSGLELRKFAEACGFDDSAPADEWEAEFEALCNQYDWHPKGPEVQEFSRMCDDRDGFGYCDDAELATIIARHFSTGPAQLDVDEGQDEEQASEADEAEVAIEEETMQPEDTSALLRSAYPKKAPTPTNRKPKRVVIPQSGADLARGHKVKAAQQDFDATPSASSRAVSPTVSPKARKPPDPAAKEDFIKWVSTRWDMIQSAFATDEKHVIVVQGSISRRGFTQKEFVDLLQTYGFAGDGNVAFRMICSECVSEKDEKRKGLREKHTKSTGNQTIGVPVFQETISLAKFSRFRARIIAEEEKDRPDSVLNNFLSILYGQRGSALSAWKLDIDQRRTGRVAYKDFIIACRRLGVASQPRRIWNAMRPQDQSSEKSPEEPLDFSELCKKESTNLNRLAEILWSALGFDLDKAWAFLDVNKQGWLNLNDFDDSVRKLGFDGDIKLLFRGLECQSPKSGRIKREDFMYIAKVTQVAPKKLKGECAPLKELIAWVQRKLHGPEQFVEKLGMGESCTEISASDFIVHLNALGFDGDVRGAVTRAARAEGGNKISMDTILQLFADSPEKRPTTAQAEAKERIRKGEWKHLRAADIGRQSWNNTVENTAENNYNLPKGKRAYFGDGKEFNPERRTASTKSLQPPTPIDRPGWDSSHCNDSHHNSDLPVTARKYFSDHRAKPIRDDIRNKLIATHSAKQLFDDKPASAVFATKLTNQAVGRFYQFLKIRFGTIDEAFHKMDVDRRSQLRKRDFLKEVHRMGYREDATLVYQHLDVNNNGWITLREFLGLEPKVIAYDPLKALREELGASYALEMGPAASLR